MDSLKLWAVAKTLDFPLQALRIEPTHYTIWSYSLKSWAVEWQLQMTCEFDVFYFAVVDLT
jgi:hypothetical protein